MIYILANSGTKTFYTEYIADSESDLNNIPKHQPGNRVYIANTKTWYILNNNRVWTKITTTQEEYN